jgi:hypothetical protein
MKFARSIPRCSTTFQTGIAASAMRSSNEPVVPGSPVASHSTNWRNSPGIREGPPTHGNRAASRLGKHSLAVGNRADVTIPHDRNSLDRFDDFPDALAIDRAAKPLFARATVDRNRRDQPCSNSRANFGAVSWRLSQPNRILTVTGRETASTTVWTSSMVLSTWHIKLATRSDFGNAMNWTSHVDIDRIDAARLQQLSGIAHDDRVTSRKSELRNGRSSGQVSINCQVLGLPSSNPRAFTRSVVASPTPPSLRTIRRNGRFV